MPSLHLILQFWNVPSVSGNVSQVFFRIQELHHGRTGAYGIFSMSFVLLLWWLAAQETPWNKPWEFTAHSQLWNLPVPLQNWSFLLQTTSFAFIARNLLIFVVLFIIIIIIITVLFPSAYFFICIPNSFKYIWVISYLYDSAQRCKWEAKPYWAGLHPYDFTG